MYPPTLAALLPHAPTSTAAEALHLTHGTLFASIGLVFTAVWFVLHRFAAHRHPVAEFIARVFLVAAGVAFAASVGVVAKWVASANDLTASWLTSWTGDSGFANDHLGALTILAFVDVAFAVSVTYDLIKHLTNKGGSGKVGHHPRWARLEDTFNKYGWFGLGPLAATLPGQFGLWVATLLTLMSEQLARVIGPYVGLG